jgi:hypothetical protein
MTATTVNTKISPVTTDSQSFLLRRVQPAALSAALGVLAAG